MSVNNGKFINAFQSIQMIGDYEQSNENSHEMENNNDSQTPNEKNEPLYNGDDLYNPLELVDSSDNDSTGKNKTKIDDPETDRMQNISPISSPESEERSMSNEIKEEEFSLEKSPKKSEDNDFLDDDELLGTALAELEEEEKQMEREKEEKEGKKKKKKKDKEKDDKKKKKKKKKKKSKDKIKDKEDKGDSKTKRKEEKKLSKSISESSITNEKQRNVDKENKTKKDKKKDKKHRDDSRDRDARNNKHKHSSSKESSTNSKHKKDRDRHLDHQNHRKRSHRSKSPDHNSKRSRHSDVIEKKFESRDQKHRHSSRSPSFKDNSGKDSSLNKSRHSMNRSRNEHELTSQRQQKKSDKIDAHNLLSKKEFDEIQKDARKIQRQRSSGSSSAENQRLVIEDSENSYTNKDILANDTENRSAKSKSPHSSFNNSRTSLAESLDDNKKLRKSKQDNTDIDFEMVADNTDTYDAIVSSQSDSGSVCLDSKKSTKPGALSIHEYKERRKSGKESRLSSSSQSEEEVRILSNISKSERNDKYQQTNNKEENGIHKETNDSSLYNFTNVENDEALNDDRISIPLLSESKENIEPDIADTESPYNPEASPIDFDSPQLSTSRNENGASPSQAAVDDDNVDILAYKDLVAFEDIMKSKVKHEAKKHKRKKLEEMRQELESKDPSSKEKRLVDYLIRQAQVEELMKNTLKSYFKSREITKEEYKYILKKAVPQVTMSGSSIVPAKIESLMVKFVRKCKGQRAKEAKEEKRKKQHAEIEKQQKELQQQIQTNAAMLNTLGGFEMKALNPNLPLPPM